MHTYICIDNEYIYIYKHIFCVYTCVYTTYIYVFIYIYTHTDIQCSSDWITYFPIFAFQYETLGKATNIAFGKIESMWKSTQKNWQD